MMHLRHSQERGYFDHGWLKTFHTFSFGDYLDPGFMGFRTLRVINEDTVAEAEGFGTHPHRDMEIVTYVLDGALEHKDSMGNGSVIRPGEIQYMSAGKGVTHSEFNHSKTEPCHFLQIWILPDRTGYDPAYAQKRFEESERLNRLRLIASADGAEGSVQIRQDVKLFASVLESGKSVEHAERSGRHQYVQVARGEIEMNGKRLKAGDGASISGESSLAVKGVAPKSEFLLFDLN